MTPEQALKLLEDGHAIYSVETAREITKSFSLELPKSLIERFENGLDAWLKTGASYKSLYVLEKDSKMSIDQAILKAMEAGRLIWKGKKENDKRKIEKGLKIIQSIPFEKNRISCVFSLSLSNWITRKLNLSKEHFFGRGSQARENVKVIREYLKRRE